MDEESKPEFWDYMKIPGMAWFMGGYWAICLVAGVALYFKG